MKTTLQEAALGRKENATRFRVQRPEFKSGFFSFEQSCDETEPASLTSSIWVLMMGREME